MSPREVSERSPVHVLVDAWERTHGPKRLPTEVWARWSGAEKPTIQRGSLRTLLARWRAGDARLAEHPGLRRAIVSVLSAVRPVSEDELFGEGVEARPPSSGFPFIASPALGELDPTIDEPFHAAALHRVRGPRAPAASIDDAPQSLDLLDLPVRDLTLWVVLPPGAGRSFAAHRTRHRGRSPGSPYGRTLRPPEVLSLVTPSVEALDTVGDDVPLLIELEALGDGTRAFLDRLSSRREGCAVLASSAPPEPVGDFQVYAWRADVAWREGYVRWVARRLERLGVVESRLDVTSFLAWIARVDPHVTCFATPGDLLPLLDHARAHGVDTLPKQAHGALVRQVLTTTFARFGGVSVRDRWRRELGARTFTRMLKAWWRTPAMRWDVAPTRDEWAALVPADALPSSTEAGERARALVHELKEGRPSEARRAEIASALEAALPDDVPAHEVVCALVEAGVLRETSDGRLRVSPPWMADAMARAAVGRALTVDAPTVWGRWCVDPARRPLVEERLLALDAPTLVALVARAVETFDARSLGAVAALEALFVVVGGRLAQEPEFGATARETLRHLARLQIQLLAPRHPGGLPAPRTRAGPGEPDGHGAAFVAACWAWSLRLETPPVLSASVSPLFPGWCAPSLDDLAAGLLPDHGRQTDTEHRGVGLLRALLPAVLERASDAFDRAERPIPRSVAEAAIPLAARRGWPMAKLISVFRSPSLAESERLARRLEALDEGVRAQTVDAMWTALLGASRSAVDALAHFEPDGPTPREFPRSPLTILLHARFPAGAIVSAVMAFKRWDAESGALLLRRTPAGHQLTIARALAKALDSEAHTTVDILKPFGRELVEVLVGLAALSDGTVATRAVWEVAPDVACVQAEREYACGSLGPWVRSTPAHCMGMLLEVAARHPPSPGPEGLRYWLSQRLLEVGPEAEHVWALLQRVGWPGSEGPRRPTEGAP